MIADDLAIRLPMSPFLTATLARAADYAGAQSHVEVSVEHLLLALTEDPEATVVLKASSVDVARLKNDVSDFIGRIEDRHPEGSGGHVAVSTDLRRILEAAAAAAQQGRRREINGAIVLAAIVGDGKSGAAHMLREQGLTFEEAIRALQRAAQQQAGVTAAPTPRQPPQATADDILASARERIQTRAAAPRAPEPATSTAPATPRFGGAPPPDAQLGPIAGQGLETRAPPAPAPSAPAQPDVPLQGMIERGPDPQLPGAFPPSPSGNSHLAPDLGDVAPGSPPPQLDGTPRQGQPRRGPSWAPPTPRAPPQQASGPPPRGRVPPPLPPNPGPMQVPGQLPNQPPFPAGGPPPPGAPRGAPQSRVPWPEAIEPPAPPPSQARQDGTQRQRQPGPRPVISAGQLVHNIPPKMTVGVSLVCEARIGRAEIKAIVDGLQGGGAVVRHEIMVTKAMSVRLRSPDGGFFIESSSPETQWIENVLGLPAEDFARWRWTITPREKGRKRLQLIVSARTVGGDGLTAETAMPDQVVEIRVRTNYGRSIKRWLGWGFVAILGGILGRFGDVAFGFIRSLLGG